MKEITPIYKLTPSYNDNISFVQPRAQLVIGMLMGLRVAFFISDNISHIEHTCIP
jgi:hypothetical protein